MPLLTLSPALVQLKGNLPQIGEFPLPDGAAGNLRTVEAMKSVARTRAGHPAIRAMAASLVQFLPSMDHLEEARVIGQWVQSQMRYTRDPSVVEQLKDPILMLEEIARGEGHGDCDDQALLAATLLGSIGHYPLFRIVRYHTTYGPYNHIYLVVYERNGLSGEQQRLVIDPIVKPMPIGYEVPHKSGQEISVF